MQQLVSDPNAHVADDLHAAIGSVELTDPHYHLDQVTVVDGVTTVDFTAESPSAASARGPIPGHFTMVGAGDDARVEWSPAVIHPQLKPGLSLARTRAWADRAPILGPGRRRRSSVRSPP